MKLEIHVAKNRLEEKIEYFFLGIRDVKGNWKTIKTRRVMVQAEKKCQDWHLRRKLDDLQRSIKTLISLYDSLQFFKQMQGTMNVDLAAFGYADSRLNQQIRVIKELAEVLANSVNMETYTKIEVYISEKNSVQVFFVSEIRDHIKPSKAVRKFYDDNSI